MRQNQERKRTMQQIAKGGPQKSGVKKPAPAKPAGSQPRAITNGSSPGMKQLRAKAVQARRQAQGKSTVASRNPGITPDSAKGQRIRSAAKAQRVPGDSGQVRAAQAQGKKNVAQAQAKRGAKAASKAMEAKLKQAAAKRAAGSGLKAGVKAAVFAEGLTSRNTGDGTLTAAAKRGDLKKTYAQDEAKARAKNAERKAADAKKPAKDSFDDAFRDARRAKVKTFTWRGKKYTTEMK
jgi:hypothetical protein